jgi:hypothetical protein
MSEPAYAPVYNPFVSFSLRLAIMFSPALVWGLLYLTSRLGRVPLTRFTPWLRTGFVVLMGISLMLFVFDRTRLSNVVAIHAWGLFGAELWVQRRRKQEAGQFLTSLKL